jgi:hypothetical protein
MVHTMVTVETLALLGCAYAFPKPSSEPSADRGGRSVDGVQHACDMFMAYIGVLRVPYRQDERLATAILRCLDKYLDDLISPKVWIKLDDLVKARSRGDKFGEQQLLNPQRKTLAERMTNNVHPINVMGGIERQVPSFAPNSPAFKHGSPSLLHSPASHMKPVQSRSIPTGPRIALQPLRISVPIGPRNAIPPRHMPTHSSNSDQSDSPVGPKRSRQRSKRGNGGPMDPSQRGQGGPRLGIDPLDRWFER